MIRKRVEMSLILNDTAHNLLFHVHLKHFKLLKTTVIILNTMILSIRTERPGQTVQTQIRLLLEEKSDQGLHCLQFCLHQLEALL